MPTGPNYWDYLKLDRLLDLQGGVSESGDVDSADELHFIVVHQVYELWFKLILRSLRLARDRLAEPRVSEETIPYVVHHLRRVSTVLGLAVDHWKVVETLTPQDFLAFRDKLTPASGFQSFQLRELEIVMGLEDAERVGFGNVRPLEHIRDLGADSPGGRLAWLHVQRAREEQSFLAALNEWLFRTPIYGITPDQAEDEATVTSFVDAYLEASEQNQARGLERLVEAHGEGQRETIAARFRATRDAGRAFLHAEDAAPDQRFRIRRIRAAALFIESYRELPLLAWPRLLLDNVVEMEEQMVLFRNGHARMVERVIGRRVGTGGSGGVDYLDRTLNYRVFRDLWALRGVLLPKDRLPPLRNAHFYEFVSE